MKYPDAAKRAAQVGVMLEADAACIAAYMAGAERDCAMLEKLEARCDELEALLNDGAELVSDAIANHESGSKCDMELSAAAVWLSRAESLLHSEGTK